MDCAIEKEPLVFDLVALGRPYTDFIVELPDDTLIERCGVPKGKASEVGPGRIAYFLHLLPAAITYPGGSPSNTCAVVQALGGRAAFLGKVCNDASGRYFREGFSRVGVAFPSASFPTSHNAVSGTCIILKSRDGAETMVHCPGVGDILDLTDISSEVISQSKLLYVQAHLLFAPTSHQAVQAGIAEMSRLGRPVVFSLHDHHFTRDRATAFLNQHLGARDMVIGNRQEFVEVLRPLDSGVPENTNSLLIMTDGPNGAWVVGRGERLFVSAPHPSHIENTIGAGDAFAAGFFYGYVHGLTVPQCADLASAAAGKILEMPSGRPEGDWSQVTRKFFNG